MCSAEWLGFVAACARLDRPPRVVNRGGMSLFEYQITKVARLYADGIRLVDQPGEFTPNDLAQAGWRLVSTFARTELGSRDPLGAEGFLYGVWEREKP